MHALHEHHHRHRRHPGRWRHYFGAHLHRRLFAWFVLSTLATGLVVALLFHLLGGATGRGQRIAMVGGAVLVLWIAAGKIARHLARPLAELVRVTREIGAGRLSARAELPPWLEVGEIAIVARALNDMAARIERQIADQRELLAGVSHELRTPLARVRVLIDLARQKEGERERVGDGEHAPTGGGELWDEVEREVLEIDALVGELLASARLDFTALTRRSLDGRDVAARALERAGLPASALQAETAGADALRVEADPTLLARALANLLENARRHGGGVDRLIVRRSPADVTFEITDRGPGFVTGPQPEGQPEPPRDRPEGSLGLGLILVRRIADAHGGTLLLGTRSDGVQGASAQLTIPRHS